jgi:choline kinase
MRALIIAAGMGRRLAPYTDDRPKCLVPVNGRTILERQLEAYRAVGVTELAIVRGYRKEQVVVPGARHYDNDAYRENNILVSMFYAEEAMQDVDQLLVSYSDIVFTRATVEAALRTEGDYALVIDRRWKEAYEGRIHHPVEEGEVARVVDNRVLVVGKKTVPPDEAAGEFIGLARFSRRALETMRARYHARRAELGDEKPYGTAPRFRSAYLTDLLNDLIESGETMRPAWIDGGWREIDTVEDLERAAKVVGE